jgi:hypothetical protein
MWFSTLRRCGWHHLAPSVIDSFASEWMHSRKQVPNERRKAFDSLVIAISWSVWLERNEHCIARNCKPPASVILDIWNLIDMWCRAGHG